MKKLYCVGCQVEVARIQADQGNMLLQHIVIRCGTCENKLQRDIAQASEDVDKKIKDLMGDLDMDDLNSEPKHGVGASSGFADMFSDNGLFGKNGSIFNPKK